VSWKNSRASCADDRFQLMIRPDRTEPSGRIWALIAGNRPGDVEVPYRQRVQVTGRGYTAAPNPGERHVQKPLSEYPDEPRPGQPPNRPRRRPQVLQRHRIDPKLVGEFPMLSTPAPPRSASATATGQPAAAVYAAGPLACTRRCRRYLRLYWFHLLLMRARQVLGTVDNDQDDRHHGPQRDAQPRLAH
jgi:hypothetical protein